MPSRRPPALHHPLLARPVPEVPAGSLVALRRRARACTACPLYAPATQTVFGEGPAAPAAVLIGEQPGNDEDLAGHPFVGPAGVLLDRALAEAGIDRAALYLTNAVKHFKFEPRGKRRLHKRPNAAEQYACRRWLAAELDRLQPSLIVCLGAMAAEAVFGTAFRLTRERGQWREIAPGVQAMATAHPSSVLRAPDSVARAAAYRALVADLETVAAAIRSR